MLEHSPLDSCEQDVSRLGVFTNLTQIWTLVKAFAVRVRMWDRNATAGLVFSKLFSIKFKIPLQIHKKFHTDRKRWFHSSIAGKLMETRGTTIYFVRSWLFCVVKWPPARPPNRRPWWKKFVLVHNSDLWYTRFGICGSIERDTSLKNLFSYSGTKVWWGLTCRSTWLAVLGDVGGRRCWAHLCTQIDSILIL